MVPSLFALPLFTGRLISLAFPSMLVSSFTHASTLLTCSESPQLVHVLASLVAYQAFPEAGYAAMFRVVSHCCRLSPNSASDLRLELPKNRVPAEMFYLTVV